MKKKWMLILVCSLALIAMVGVSAALAATDADTDVPQRPERQNLTDEQLAEMQAQMEERRAEMEARMTERQAQWDALTDAQKEDIYDLQRQLIDKYLELGLIDAEQAAQMLERIGTEGAQMMPPDGHMKFGETPQELPEGAQAPDMEWEFDGERPARPDGSLGRFGRQGGFDASTQAQPSTNI